MIKTKNKSSGIASTPEREAERKRKISETMKSNPKAGGLRKGSGRGKKGWYKGYWCDSSWELAWVIYQLDHNIKFERNTTPFKYIYQNVEHFYYPDFKIGDEYYEVKGRRSYLDLDNITKEKISQFKGNLTVLYSNSMNPILKYVECAYGKNYVELYDDSKYIKKVNYKQIRPIVIRKKRIILPKKYCNCGTEICRNSKMCVECSRINQRTVERPSYERLLTEIGQLGYCGVGRKYGVSDNAIRKWVRNFNR